MPQPTDLAGHFGHKANEHFDHRALRSAWRKMCSSCRDVTDAMQIEPEGGDYQIGGQPVILRPITITGGEYPFNTHLLEY